jgi:hypothetical protein
MPFEKVHAITDVMIGFEAPWCIGGGWAIALMIQREVRARGNVEFAVLRDDSRALRERLSDWKVVADHGTVKSGWPVGEPVPPAVTNAFATSPDGVEARIRIFDSAHGLWFPCANRALTLPLSRLRWHTPDTIPYLVPEAALLGLAPGAGANEHIDLRAALPFLDGQSKLWLDRALAMTIPDHPWRTVLTPPRPPAPTEELRQDSSEE